MNYFKLDQFDQAEQYLLAAKRLDPAHYYQPQIFLAEIYTRRGNRRAAIQELEDVLALRPDGPLSDSIRHNLAQLSAARQVQSPSPIENSIRSRLATRPRPSSYIKGVLEAEGIPVTVAAKDPSRANLIARLKGNGSKRPILLMGHTDTVQVDPSKWTFPSVQRHTRQAATSMAAASLDNKWQVAAGMMTMLLLKRGNIALDRDVIFVAEAGEEADTGPASSTWSKSTGPKSRPKTASPNPAACAAKTAGAFRPGANRRENAERRAPRSERSGWPRLAADAHQRHPASFTGGRENRFVGSTHADERYHAHIFRKTRGAWLTGGSRKIQRSARPR